MRLIFIIQKMIKTNHLLFLLYLSLALNAISFAQFEEQEMDPVFQMEDFVVTASRFGQSLSELSPSVSAFPKKTIEEGLYLNVRDVLNQIPGLHIAANGGMGKVSSMFTRGSESNHTAILLNGRRMPTGASGQYDLGNLSLSNVGSIEVVRGDNSSLYGGAIGGVVNIRSDFATGGLKQKIKLESGSDNAKFLNYNYGVSSDKLNASFAINSASTDGYQENTAYERDSANLYLVYSLNNSVNIDFQYLYYDANVGVGTSFGSPTLEENLTKAYMYSPGLSFDISNSSKFKLTANFSKNELKAVKTLFSYDKRFTEEIDSLESVYEFSDIKNKGKSVFGLLFERRKYQESPVNDFSTSNVDDYIVSYDTRSFFTNTIYQIDEFSELEFGGRIDNFSNNFDTSKSGSLKYSKSLNNEFNTRIHGKYSYGKNPPDLLVLAYGNSYNFFLSDNNIQLETIRSKEVGFKTDLGDHELGFVYFDNSIMNLSATDYSEFPTVRRVLIDSTQRGSESYLSGNLADNVQYLISYSYLNAKDEEGNQLIRRPKHKLMASVTKAFKDLNIGISMNKISDLLDSGNVKLDDYSVVRVFGTYTLDENRMVHFRLENAFDREYDYLNGYPAPPKQGYLGFTYKF